MSSPSPQRSASRFPPRPNYATSSRPFRPPAPTRPARTRRPGRRTRTMRRRRPSKGEPEDRGEEEEGGGDGPPWWWPWTKRRCTPTRRWWMGWTERTRPGKTVRRAGRRFEERRTGFKRKHTNTQSCRIKVGHTVEQDWLPPQRKEKRLKKIHWGCTNCPHDLALKDHWCELSILIESVWAPFSIIALNGLTCTIL